MFSKIFSVKHIPLNIIISRTDSVGDMILALPVAKVLKDHFPEIKIAMLGKKYTKAVAEACEYIDEFIDAEDFYNKNILIDNQEPQAIVILNTDMKIARRAKDLKIPIRIGTGRNIVFLKTCNYPVWFSRRKSSLNEAQLNLKLLRPFKIKKTFQLEFIVTSYGLTKLQLLQNDLSFLIRPDKFNLIIHTKSKGNAREWSMNNFVTLINNLDEKMYNIFITGTENEREFIQPLLNKVCKKVIDVIGLIPLEQLLPFIKSCDALLGNSTGPLHIAAAVGIDAIGLYPPIKTRDVRRWGPVGIKTHTYQLETFCDKCKYDKEDCACINSISPMQIKSQLDFLAKRKMIASIVLRG